MTDDDKTIGHARVSYLVPVKQSDYDKWVKSKPDGSDPDDDRWFFEIEEAVKDGLPDLLERTGEPEVEFN